MTADIYRPRPIKRNRRTKAEMSQLKYALLDIIAELQPMTVRQVFYQAVSQGLISKTEKEYRQTIVRLLTEMRKAEELPWQWIADNTRWMRKPSTHDSLERMLLDQQDLYRRALWNDQDVYIEVWLEKDALAGVLYDVTRKWDAPLMVTRGYPSFSFLASAAQTIRETNKPTYLYYFGDRDPTGLDIPRNVEESIRKLAVPDDMVFECVAVTEDQIIDLDLQTRPTKAKDPRAKNFKGESVELDAIHPNILREMVDECVTRHIDDEVLERTQCVEMYERRTLEEVAANLPGNAA
jgi:hypothetical protein